MTDFPWSKFFWSDWESDQGLRLCSLAAQGLWMRILCVCAKHEPKGYLAINGYPLGLDAIARLAGVAESEAGNLMEELDRNGVYSRNRAGCIYSRRMTRDEKASKEGRKHKKEGLRKAAENKQGNASPSSPPTRYPSPQKPEVRSQIRKSANALCAGFDEFWHAYPAKGRVGKKAASVRFGNAVKSGIPPDKLIAAAKAYAGSDAVLRGYTKHATTWLSQGCWDDDPGAAVQANPDVPDPRRTFLRKVAGGST